MTNAQIAGRVAGIAYVHARRTAALIDWAEVAAIVLHGLQVLIALTMLAGQMTRRAWDALPTLSEQLGKWYATALTNGCIGWQMVYDSFTGAPETPTHPKPRTMTIPADYICHGSDHGTQYAGEFGGFYSARATALACPLSDRPDRRWASVKPVSQRIERRPWAPEDGHCWQAIDESGRRFY